MRVGRLHSHDMAGPSAEVQGDAGLVGAQVVDVEHQLQQHKQAWREGKDQS